MRVNANRNLGQVSSLTCALLVVSGVITVCLMAAAFACCGQSGDQGLGQSAVGSAPAALGLATLLVSSGLWVIRGPAIGLRIFSHRARWRKPARDIPFAVQVAGPKALGIEN